MSIWPPLDVRVHTPRLLLRPMSDPEAEDLYLRAAGRVLSPENRHFMGAWTQIPSPEFERQAMQHHWHQRGTWSPDDWVLSLSVFFPRPELIDGASVPGQAAGVMSLSAKNFAKCRSCTTGSWLLPEFRCQGIGAEMRSAAIHLAFGGLGADEVRSDAHPDNEASHGVSRALGYREDGHEIKDLGHDEAVDVVRLVLKRDHWREDPEISISGFEESRDFFGAGTQSHG